MQVVAKLHSILRPFLLRRMKSDVELMLPRKKEIIVYANMTEHQKNLQDHLINETLEKYLDKKRSVGNSFFSIFHLKERESALATYALTVSYVGF
jgi:ATP-dependent DNA helicase